MKKVLLLMTLFTGLCANPVFAGQTDEVQLAKEIVQKQKKLIVLENLGLNAAEKTAFLPVYAEYQNARKHNNEALGRLIVKFADNYENMTNTTALDLLNSVLKVRQGRLDIKDAYVAKFKKILPGKKVARYYQIESKLEALAEVKLAEVIPLIQ